MGFLQTKLLYDQFSDVQRLHERSSNDGKRRNTTRRAGDAELRKVREG